MFSENVFMPDHPLFWMTGKTRLATIDVDYRAFGSILEQGQVRYKGIKVKVNPNLALLATAYKQRGYQFSPSIADVISLRRQAEEDSFKEVWKFYLKATNMTMQ